MKKLLFVTAVVTFLTFTESSAQYEKSAIVDSSEVNLHSTTENKFYKFKILTIEQAASDGKILVYDIEHYSSATNTWESLLRANALSLVKKVDSIYLEREYEYLIVSFVDNKGVKQEHCFAFGQLFNRHKKILREEWFEIKPPE